MRRIRIRRARSTARSRWLRARDDRRAVPYHVAYREWVEPAAQSLARQRSSATTRHSRISCACAPTALLTDDYYESDLAWLDLKDPKFDVIFAPYETYLDDLLGVKTSYGASVLIRNEEESRKLAVLSEVRARIFRMRCRWRPRTGLRRTATSRPMEVMDAPYRAGDLRHGYQAVADNLPNDPRIHQEKGTKKIFFKNFMDARVKYVILPIAQSLMTPEQAAKARARAIWRSRCCTKSRTSSARLSRARTASRWIFARRSVRRIRRSRKPRRTSSACSA